MHSLLESNSGNTGAIIGVVVGGIVGIVFIAILSVIMWCYCKQYEKTNTSGKCIHVFITYNFHM